MDKMQDKSSGNQLSLWLSHKLQPVSSHHKYSQTSRWVGTVHFIPYVRKNPLGLLDDHAMDNMDSCSKH